MRALALVVLLTGAPGQEASTDHPVDAWFEAAWRAAGVRPASEAGGAEIFRRLTLDLLGRLPTADEVRAFLAEPEEGRVGRTIDRLLASEEHSGFLADWWMDVLLDHDVTQQDFARADLGPLRSWLRRQLWEDAPWDATVRALLADRGPRREKPAVNFLLKHLGAEPLPVKAAVMSSRLFADRDIRCAQCHDHPYEAMTQDDFWGYVEFFRPLRNRGALVELDRAPSTGEPREDFGELQGLAPRFLDGRAPENGRRLGESLADLTLSMEGRPSSRVLVHRLWRHLFGRWLVPPGRSRPPQAGLLDRLTAHFDAVGGSVRKLLRAMLTSRAYRLTSEGRESDREAYAVGPVKLMGSIQFMTVFAQVFDLEAVHKEMYRKVAESPVAGAQFKDPEVMRLLFFQWSRDLLLPRGRSAEDTVPIGTVRMAIKFMNNRRITSMMVAEWGALKDVFRKRRAAEHRVEELYLGLLGRPPLRSEVRDALDGADTEHAKRRAVEDLFWAIVNSSEFLFNH